VDVLDALAGARARGERVVLVTVLAVDGDAPSRPGAKLVVGLDGVLAGTLGCAEFDAAGMALAGEALAGDVPLRVRRTFSGEEAHGAERALELFAEPQLPEPAVLVLGSNPLARALAALSRQLGRRTLLIAPGGDAAVAAGVEVRADDPVRFLLKAPPGPEDAIVLSDHDAPWVEEVLRVALASRAPYVGMPGSRRHAPLVVRRLREAGVPEEHVSRLRSPVGLDIGSRSPEEIALSILAEVLAVSRGRPGGPMLRDWLAS
jgi:xanthine dehydrogenase accessory factor